MNVNGVAPASLAACGASRNLLGGTTQSRRRRAMNERHPPGEVVAQLERQPEDVAVTKSVELGRGVRSQQYGKGFIADIEGDVIKVRFWKGGYKTFHKTEGDPPFDLLDEVRPVKRQSVVEKARARETRTEKGERALRCSHRDKRSLCPKCAELPESEVEKWNPRRTNERRVSSRGLSLNQYNGVTLASNDRVLVSRPRDGQPVDAVSSSYQCRQCGARASQPGICSRCAWALVAVSEPSQRKQFSSEFGKGARRGDYADAQPAGRAPNSKEAAVARDFFMTSKGGTVSGYIRIPLSAPRGTRADTPGWIEQRGRFLQTLAKDRVERAERIL